MSFVDNHLIKGGITTGGKTVAGKTPAEAEGKSLRDLTWLTATDIKILVIG